MDNLQAAVYGIGVCAEFGGSAFRPLVGGILIKLLEMNAHLSHLDAVTLF